MRKSLRKRFGGRVVEVARRNTPAVIEEMERRVLLSGTPVAANAYADISSATGTEVSLDLFQYSALAPNGDIVLAYEEASIVGHPNDIIVAAFKEDGSSGFALDMSFGDYNNDSSHVASPGFAIVDVAALLPALEISGDQTPLGIAIDPNGNVNVLWTAQGAGWNGVFQLSANGAAVNGSGALPEHEVHFAQAGGIAVNPVANANGTYDAFVAGANEDPGGSLDGNATVWGFQEGALDTSLGGGTGILYSTGSTGFFTAIAANGNGIYVGQKNSGSSMTIDEIALTGSLTVSATVNVNAPSGDQWSPDSLFGLGLAGDGDVIFGGALNQTSSFGYAVVRLTSSLGSTTWGPNGNGQIFIANASPQEMAVNSNGDVLVNDSPDDTLVTETATWISGITGAQESLEYPYTSTGSASLLSATIPVFDSSGDAILAAGYSPSSGVGDETLARYDTSPDAPQLESAASVQDNLNGNSYGINMAVNVGFDQIPGVEDRNTQPIYEALDFSGPIALASDFLVSLKDISGSSDGSVSNSTMAHAQIDSSNPDQLDIPVSGWTNGQTMVITVQGVENSGSTIEGTYTLKVGFLLGDVFDAHADDTVGTSSEGVVSGDSFSAFIGNLGSATTLTNFESDLDGDGAIGGSDFSILVGNLGKSLNYDG
jgi:hypothetical protein